MADNKEYIERDESIRKAIDACIKVVGHGITQFDAVDIAEMMESISTADVVEVQHGEWVIDKGTFDLCGVEHYKCSICGGQTQVKYPNCPWCIAKMDGGKVI